MFGRALRRNFAQFRLRRNLAYCPASHSARSEGKRLEKAVVEFVVCAFVEKFLKRSNRPRGQKLAVEPKLDVFGGAFKNFAVCKGGL